MTPTPIPTPLPYSAQIADQFVPIYGAMAVVAVVLLLLGAYLLLVKPFLRG